MPAASIIVVDSEPVVREVIRKILTGVGYSVRATGEFDEAFEMVRQSLPDLVITNVFLKGIRGHDAMRNLRREFPHLRVLMVSGLPDDEAIQGWSNEAGFDAFPKPFTAAALREKVGQTLAAADGHSDAHQFEHAGG
jgi:CheY-like chemotaxis protein